MSLLAAIQDYQSGSTQGLYSGHLVIISQNEFSANYTMNTAMNWTKNISSNVKLQTKSIFFLVRLQYT